MTNRDAGTSRAPALLGVTVIALLLVGALASAIGSLNRDVYSAGGFVRQYLEALSRQDTAAALSLPGVMPTAARLEEAGLPSDLPSTLLRASVLRELTDLRLTGDTQVEPGVNVVDYEFRLGDTVETMEFTVESTGTFAGVFSAWRFRESPLAVVDVTVLHTAVFTVNDLTLDTRVHAGADAPSSFSHRAAYLAFAPGLYTFSHASALLDSEKTTIAVTGPGSAAVTIDAQPNATFVAKVQAELDSFLDDCARQRVLLPSDCPFGVPIDDRVLAPPTWSIVHYPDVSLAGGDSAFEMPATEGLAHIVVDVQSLFDGEVGTRDEDVPFTVALTVVVQADNSLDIRLH